jgi:hypothetical protein
MLVVRVMACAAPTNQVTSSQLEYATFADVPVHLQCHLCVAPLPLLPPQTQEDTHLAKAVGAVLLRQMVPVMFQNLSPRLQERMAAAQLQGVLRGYERLRLMFSRHRVSIEELAGDQLLRIALPPCLAHMLGQVATLMAQTQWGLRWVVQQQLVALHGLQGDGTRAAKVAFLQISRQAAFGAIWELMSQLVTASAAGEPAHAAAAAAVPDDALPPWAFQLAQLLVGKFMASHTLLEDSISHGGVLTPSQAFCAGLRSLSQPATLLDMVRQIVPLLLSEGANRQWGALDQELQGDLLNLLCEIMTAQETCCWAVHARRLFNACHTEKPATHIVQQHLQPVLAQLPHLALVLQRLQDLLSQRVQQLRQWEQGGGVPAAGGAGMAAAAPPAPPPPAAAGAAADAPVQQQQQQQDNVAAANAAYVQQEEQQLHAVAIALEQVQLLQANPAQQQQLTFPAIRGLSAALEAALRVPQYWVKLCTHVPQEPSIAGWLRASRIPCTLPVLGSWWQQVFAVSMQNVGYEWNTALQVQTGNTAVSLGLPRDWAWAAMEGMVLLSSSVLSIRRTSVAGLHQLLREVMQLQQHGVSLSNLGEALAAHWDPSMRLVQPRLMEGFAQVRQGATYVQHGEER